MCIRDRGIAPFYSDKYQKKTIMAGELLYPEKLWDHLAGILEWKNLTLERVYGAKPYTMDDLKAWVAEFGEKIKPFICDTGAFLRQAQAEGKHILFEACLLYTSRSPSSPPSKPCAGSSGRTRADLPPDIKTAPCRRHGAVLLYHISPPYSRRYSSSSSASRSSRA